MSTDTTDSKPSTSKVVKKKRVAKKKAAKKPVEEVKLEVATQNTYRYCGGVETARLFLEGEEIPAEYSDTPEG